MLRHFQRPRDILFRPHATHSLDVVSVGMQEGTNDDTSYDLQTDFVPFGSLTRNCNFLKAFHY